jgi:hypothetical protein
VVKVLKREGISAEGHATMPRFDDQTPREAVPEAAGAKHTAAAHRRSSALDGG